MNTIRSRFHRVNPQTEQVRAEAAEREIHGVQYSLFVQGIRPYEFKDNLPRVFFRLLPQPEDAQNAWSLTLPFSYIDPNMTPGHRGYLPLTIRQAAFLDNARRALYSNPEFAPMMAGEANRNGISATVKYKSVFMGFCHNDPDPRVMPIVLPSSGFTRPKGAGRLQVGTIINSFVYDVDSVGAPKWGDITDLDSGRLIGVEVSGESRDRREYTASVDRVFPLTDQHNFLLDQVRKFEDIIAYHSDSVIYETLRLKLRPEMWDYLVRKLGICVQPILQASQVAA